MTFDQEMQQMIEFAKASQLRMTEEQMPQQHSVSAAIRQYVKDNSITETSTPIPFPFEVMSDIEVVDGVSVTAPPVYIRNGGFIWKENGETKFAGTDESTTQAGYDIESIDETFAVPAAGNLTEVWATLDLSGTDPVAALATAALATDDNQHFSILIGKINEYGGIEQYKFEHIDLGEVSGLSGINHSFRPINNNDGTIDITAGVVYIEELTPVTLPTGADLTNVNITDYTHFQIKVDWSSNLVNPDVTWEKGTSFGTNTSLVRYYPILLVASAGDFSSIVRRQTNDLHIPKTLAQNAVRGTKALFKVPMLLAYYGDGDNPSPTDVLVDPWVEYNPSTMYLHWTWDYSRER